MRLLGALVADAGLTILSCGIYPAIRAGEGERSFTGQVLEAKRQEKQNEQELEALRLLAQIAKGKK